MFEDSETATVRRDFLTNCGISDKAIDTAISELNITDEEVLAHFKNVKMSVGDVFKLVGIVAEDTLAGRLRILFTWLIEAQKGSGRFRELIEQA